MALFTPSFQKTKKRALRALSDRGMERRLEINGDEIPPVR
jgi:hypothetical protein